MNAQTSLYLGQDFCRFRWDQAQLESAANMTELFERYDAALTTNSPGCRRLPIQQNSLTFKPKGSVSVRLISLCQVGTSLHFIMSQRMSKLTKLHVCPAKTQITSWVTTQSDLSLHCPHEEGP